MASEGMQGRIVQINRSRGGVPKLPIEEARVTELGLDGDLHDDIASHGGPLRALCIFTLEEIKRLKEEGHPIYPGAVGENLTLNGIPLAMLTPGMRLALGDEVEAEVTSYTSPCKTIRGAFRDGDFNRISSKINPGESRVYARVLRTGVIHAGDVVRVLSEP